jgi:hypothetical protein
MDFQFARLRFFSFIKHVLLFLLLLSIPLSGISQIITTVAGNGSIGFSGDGGPATAASFFYAWHVVPDTMGNIYFTDAFNHRVRKVNSAGVISTFAGTGTIGYSGDGGAATAAQLNGATGLAIGNDGSIYVGGLATIRKVSPSGIISTIAGTDVTGFSGDGGPATAAQLENAYGLTLDAVGNLYFADASNNRIRKINLSTDGFIHTIAGNGSVGSGGDGGPATAAQLFGIAGVAISAMGELYISENGGNRIRKISTSGVISTIAGNGTPGFSGDGGPASASVVSAPYGLAFGFDGILYFSDHGTSRIRKIGPGDTINTIGGIGTDGFSGDGGLASAAELYWPNGIATDAKGNIFVCDWKNYRIRRISTFNRAPYFTLGDIAHLNACGEFNSIDTLLQTVDSNSMQSITWSLLSAPAHGTAIVSYTTTSTSGVLTPTGLGYSPTVGYTGPDTFKVRVTDGGASDTITIAVDVQLFPTAAPITGADTICVGSSATLAGASAGGTWSSSDATVGVGAGTGVVTGVSVGTASITYTVTNFCGTATATYPVTILPMGLCPTGINTVTNASDISIYPNPNTGAFTVQLPEGVESHITIADITGRKVKEYKGAASCTCILPTGCAGVYIVEVVTGGERWYGRVVVR